MCRVEKEVSGMITNTKDLCKSHVDTYNCRSFLKCNEFSLLELLASGFP